ncbi:MAG TPA: AsmA family protein, partial [Chitinophagaceae bacterium]
MKKILKISGITLLVLIILAILIPIVFKKQITNLVKKEINNSINATVDFSDVSLSLFRHFPKVSIRIKNLSVIGKDEFAGDTLVYTEKADASANLWSVIKGKEIKVFGLFLESPYVQLLMNKEGKANWDIAKASTDTTTSTDTSSAFKMSLKIYQINNGHIVYNDESSNTYLDLKEVDHTGSGDLTDDIFTLKTNTTAGSASFSQGGIPYLVNSKTVIQSDIKIDNTTQTYTFKTDDISLNNLALSADGFFQLVNDSSYKMDINFKSPSNDFKDILSLIPAVYKNDFDKIKTSGSAVFNGFVKGTYSPQQMPAYDVKVEVKDGMFQYPDLPQPVKNIQFALHAANPDGEPDNAVIDIAKGHLEMGAEPFDFRFLFKNPETIQYIDAAAKGKLELSQLSQFIKLEEGTRLSGSVQADAFAKGNMSAIAAQQGPFVAGG